MKSSGLSFSIRLSSVFCFALFAACAYASNGYSISATNVTMPANGTATTKYTVSEIPIRGDLSINCAYSGPQTDANLPVCDGGTTALIPVNAGQTVTGSVVFYPYGSAIPAVKHAQQHLPASGLALAGALLIGLSSRRKKLRWPTPILFTLACATALTACGGSTNGTTPGTYQYTVSAETAGTNNPLAAQATTTISVTVP
jgi:hypothetical protein